MKIFKKKTHRKSKLVHIIILQQVESNVSCKETNILITLIILNYIKNICRFNQLQQLYPLITQTINQQFVNLKTFTPQIKRNKPFHLDV